MVHERQKQQIQLAIEVVVEIEEQVKERFFPAWDSSAFGEKHRPVTERFRVCVNNVVAVYCAHAKGDL